MPEVDYVVITAGTYDLLDRDRLRGQRGAAALPRRAAAGHRGRARDRDVRLPAAGQADLPVGRALVDRPDVPVRHRTEAPRRRSRSGPDERLRWLAAGRALAMRRPGAVGSRNVAGRGDPRPDRGRGRRQPRADGRPDRPRRSSSRVRGVTRPTRRRARSAAIAEAAVVGGARSTIRTDPDARPALRPGRPDRQLGLPDGDRDDRRRHRPVARDADGDPGPARPRRAVRHRRPRPAARRTRSARRGSSWRARSRSRRRPILVALTGGVAEPVLLHVPADRGRRRARRARRPMTVGLTIVAALGYLTGGPGRVRAPGTHRRGERAAVVGGQPDAR